MICMQAFRNGGHPLTGFTGCTVVLSALADSQVHIRENLVGGNLLKRSRPTTHCQQRLFCFLSRVIADLPSRLFEPAIGWSCLSFMSFSSSLATLVFICLLYSSFCFSVYLGRKENPLRGLQVASNLVGEAGRRV